VSFQTVANLPSSVPCRVRCALALNIARKVSVLVSSEFAAALDGFASLAWEWVEADLPRLKQFYEAFDKLHVVFTELDEGEEPNGQAAFLGACCVLWEVYNEAWQLKRVTSSELPGEVCEGDAALWVEFAEALNAVEESLPAGLARAVERTSIAMAGAPDNRETRPSRSDIEAAFERAMT